MSLAEFLVKLATDISAREAFDSDPEAFMEEMGLTETQREVLRNKQLGEIRYAVDAELKVEGETTHVTFFRPVWFHWPVWFTGTSDASDEEEEQSS